MLRFEAQGSRRLNRIAVASFLCRVVSGNARHMKAELVSEVGTMRTLPKSPGQGCLRQRGSSLRLPFVPMLHVKGLFLSAEHHG